MPHPKSPLFFTNSPLDRLAERRADLAFTESLLSRPETLLLPLWRNTHLLSTEQGVLHAEMPTAGAAIKVGVRPESYPWIFLGAWQDRYVIALDLGDASEDVLLPWRQWGQFEDLRPAMAQLADQEAAILAHARALVNWQRRSRYCGRCGKPCRSIASGHAMECPSCQETYFPRTDPVVIMRVSKGDRLLLARHQRFRDIPRFSVLAGFVEPGESLEEAVSREIREEVGVDAHNITYCASQPWPFPSNLMIAFAAQTDTETITIDDEEIIAARWFTREEIRSPDRHGFELPPRQSIAWFLIEDWLAET